jgi:hypothetical protein
MNKVLIAATALMLCVSASAGPPEKDGVVLLFPAFGPEVGDAQLVRTPNGVQINISTSGLEPYAVYTVWWVIDYGACVQWATGHPVGPSGNGQFSARLNVGDTSGDQPEGACPGLEDPQNQVIWAVLRTHGPRIPGRVYEQMGTYNGGCDENICTDDQIVVFLSTL